MKHCISLILLSCLVVHSSADVSETIPLPKTDQLHVNIFNNHQVSNDQASQMQAQSSSASLAMQENNFLAYFQQQLSPENFQYLKQEAYNAQARFLNYAKNHKLNFTFNILGSCYAYIWLKLLYYAHHILKDNTWACWKSSVPFEMLTIIPQQELGKELVFAAQEKYQKPDTLKDLLTPLVFFLRDVEYECKNLEAFLNIHSWLKTLKLSWFFPEQKKLQNLALEKFNRLSYIKNVFIRWVTDYKLAIDRSVKEPQNNPAA